MKLNLKSSIFQSVEQPRTTPVIHSKVSTKTAQFSQENNIRSLHEINIVDDYFKIFEHNLSEAAIKNLISARLQPGYQLPQVHDTKALSEKATELLAFSLAI